MKVLVVNGPNINFIGIREKELYGTKTYNDLVNLIYEYSKKLGIDVEVFQSNHEGELIDKLQEAYFNHVDAIVINPGGLTHTSVSLMDAIKAISIKTIEVHLTDIDNREDFRKISYISLVADKTIKGKGFASYTEALDYIKESENKN